MNRIASVVTIALAVAAAPCFAQEHKMVKGSELKWEAIASLPPGATL